VVKRPTVPHVVFFFVRPVLQGLLPAVFLHLAGGLEKVAGTPSRKKPAGDHRQPPEDKTNAGTLITP
jgi:hypothetical protein